MTEVRSLRHVGPVAVETVDRNTKTLTVGGATVQFQIPGQGWATVNWEG